MVRNGHFRVKNNQSIVKKVPLREILGKKSIRETLNLRGHQFFLIVRFDAAKFHSLNA